MNLMGITERFDPKKSSVALLPARTAAGGSRGKTEMGKSDEQMISKTIGKIFELKDKFAAHGGSELESLTSFREAMSKATFYNQKSYFEQEKKRHTMAEVVKGLIETSKEKNTDISVNQGTQDV